MQNTKNSRTAKNGNTSPSPSPRPGDGEKKQSIFHNAVSGEQPRTDAGYLELLSFAIFSATAEERNRLTEAWPDIIFGFKNFHVQRVAEFDESDIQDFGRRVPLLRDKPSLAAIVANAGAMLQISKVYGSFKKYVRSFEKDGAQELFNDMTERFKLMDRKISREFLSAVGEKIKLPDPPRPAKNGRPSRRRGAQANHRRPDGNQKQGAKGQTPRGGKGQGTATGTGGKDESKSQRPRRRRFGWRKKKGSGSAKPEATKKD